jgi:hypothetical protein
MAMVVTDRGLGKSRMVKSKMRLEKSSFGQKYRRNLHIGTREVKCQYFHSADFGGG